MNMHQIDATNATEINAAAMLGLFDIEPFEVTRKDKARTATTREAIAYGRWLAVRAGMRPLDECELISRGYDGGHARGVTFGASAKGEYQPGSFSVPFPGRNADRDRVTLETLNDAGEVESTATLPVDAKRAVLWKAADVARTVGPVVKVRKAKAAPRPADSEVMKAWSAARAAEIATPAPIAAMETEAAPIERPRIRLRCVAVAVDDAPIAELTKAVTLSAESVAIGPWKGAKAMLQARDEREAAAVDLQRAKRVRIVRAYLKARRERAIFRDAAERGAADRVTLQAMIREMAGKRRRAVLLARGLQVRLNAEFRTVDSYIAENSELRAVKPLIVGVDVNGQDATSPDQIALAGRRGDIAEERLAAALGRIERLEQAAVEAFVRNKPVHDALEEMTGRALRAEVALKRQAAPAAVNVVRVDFTRPQLAQAA